MSVGNKAKGVEVRAMIGTNRFPAPTTQPPAVQIRMGGFPLTKTGHVKHRTSREDKLHLLDPVSRPEATVARLQVFTRLFAHRYAGGIITRAGQGPRAWTSLRGRIHLDHIVRHLLGNRIPTLPAIWIGARSFPTTRFACIDVDPDRTPEHQLDEQYDLTNADEDSREDVRHDLLRRTKPKHHQLSFEDRCRQVERALQQLGINPHNPRHVLVQASPSGGRHYYVFFDSAYDLDQVKEVWEAAGLRHTPGQTEFFPSTGRGLRLPFGHVPSQPHDPQAWIRFTDDYTNGLIKRHSLQKLYQNLGSGHGHHGHHGHQHHHRHARWQPTHQKAAAVATFPTAVLLNGHTGAPKQEQQRTQRYRQLTERGPQSHQEAEELLALGIRTPGTRTQVLKHLAAHLIWHRHLTKEEAATTLTAWAMNPRHESKDIQYDLAHGTTKVSAQIALMCRWYAQRKQNHTETGKAPPGKIPVPPPVPPFAEAELRTLRPSFLALAPAERTPQAHFLLSFLAFAKQHGHPAPDQSGWEASPAINAVVKKWEGCRHGNDYKQRFKRATAAGLLTMTKEKWQNPKGKGRARTYRLTVPIVPQADQVIDYDTALRTLTEEPAVVDQGEH